MKILVISEAYTAQGFKHKELAVHLQQSGHEVTRARGFGDPKLAPSAFEPGYILDPAVHQPASFDAIVLAGATDVLINGSLFKAYVAGGGILVAAVRLGSLEFVDPVASRDRLGAVFGATVQLINDRVVFSNKPTTFERSDEVRNGNDWVIAWGSAERVHLATPLPLDGVGCDVLLSAPKGMGPLRTALEYVNYPAIGYPVATTRQLEQGFAILVGGDGFGETSKDHPDNLVWLENVLSYHRDEVNRQRELFSPPPRAVEPDSSRVTIRELLASGESEMVEFKERGRFDDPPGKPDEAARVLVKTVTAFLNSRGGHLLIGVNGDGEPTGLRKDYETLSKPNADGFVLWLMQTLDNWIDIPIAQYCRATVVTIDGEQVCQVTVDPAPRPVFARDRRKSKEHTIFWHRRGNESVVLKDAELVQYTRLHWQT